MKDPAFSAHQLARWREVLPSQQVVELDDVGHWPHEEAPDRVINAMQSFLSHKGHAPADLGGSRHEAEA
jgi:pimeloyl-ACP methyl ester carboxylesterase